MTQTSGIKATSQIEKAVKTTAAEAEQVARSAADTARDAGLEEAEQTADALHRAADAFDAGSIQTAALSQLAQTVNDMADTLREKPLDALIDDVAVFARKNPAIVLGGAALAGFAAARFLKAPDVRPAQDDPWSGHLDAGADTGNLPEGS
ncbi:hypothetical protein [Primorskyibacter sp. S187A]|uniref:hypothetical protein n=1 Tax=Primorskyibacter sp. S187A TaxID=3415130 RepID=UPI003C7CAF41